VSAAAAFAIALTVASVVALLLAERAGAQRGVAASKPLASLGFIATALAAGALDSSYGVTILIGLALCALGDVLLIPRGAGKSFLAGMASFALGHAAYAAAFLQRGIERTATAVALSAMAVVTFLTLRWLASRLPADMRIPIRVYILIISVMVALAVGASSAANEPFMAAGAIAFALSDLSVARERFVRAAFINLLWGLSLYYAAQIVLALSVVR
jgi:uncharacterized membrane protein YhhN